MKEGLKTEELKEAAREARRQLMREQEELQARYDELKNQILTLEATEEVLQENERRSAGSRSSPDSPAGRKSG